MTSDRPAWLQRWQQRKGETLLYRDQTICQRHSLTQAEYEERMEAIRQEAIVHERTRLLVEERQAWAAWLEAQEEHEA